MTYSVQKVTSRYWTVLGPGEQTRGYFTTKRQALERLPEYEKEDAHNTRLRAMAASGEYAWTDNEQEEIGKLAEAIRSHVTRKTFSGEHTIEETSRKEHVSDAKTIEQWGAFPDSEHGKLVCAELRWRMAARLEAFKQANLSLDICLCGAPTLAGQCSVPECVCGVKHS